MCESRKIFFNNYIEPMVAHANNFFEAKELMQSLSPENFKANNAKKRKALVDFCEANKKSPKVTNNLTNKNAKKREALVDFCDPIEKSPKIARNLLNNNAKQHDDLVDCCEPYKKSRKVAKKLPNNNTNTRGRLGDICRPKNKRNKTTNHLRTNQAVDNQNNNGTYSDIVSVSNQDFKSTIIGEYPSAEFDLPVSTTKRASPNSKKKQTEAGQYYKKPLKRRTRKTNKTRNIRKIQKPAKTKRTIRKQCKKSGKQKMNMDCSSVSTITGCHASCSEAQIKSVSCKTSEHTKNMSNSDNKLNSNNQMGHVSNSSKKIKLSVKQAPKKESSVRDTEYYVRNDETRISNKKKHKSQYKYSYDFMKPGIRFRCYKSSQFFKPKNLSKNMTMKVHNDNFLERDLCNCDDCLFVEELVNIDHYEKRRMAVDRYKKHSHYIKRKYRH